MYGIDRLLLLVGVIVPMMMFGCGCVTFGTNDSSVVAEPITEDRLIDVGRSPVPKNSVEESDGIVRITVYVDKNRLKKNADCEGTAMLRTQGLLRKHFKGIPRNYSLPVSVERADLNPDTQIYTYVSVIRRVDIDAAIAELKMQ